jgi:acyl-CoA synthetase (AMP-forming)/AMP-acid ligase II
VFDAAGVDVVLADAAHCRLLRGDWKGECLVHDDVQALAGIPCTTVAEHVDAAPFMIYPRSVTGGRLFGVTLSYRNWHATMQTNVALYRSGRYGAWDETTELYLSAQQIMHGTGFVGSFPFLSMGLPQLIVETFAVDAVLDAIEQQQVTATMFVPAMLNGVVDALAHRPDAARSLRHLLYGGGPMSAEHIHAAVRRLGPVLTQLYGRVEGGWPLSILDTGDHAALMGPRPELAQSCGRAIDEVRLKLRPLPNHQPGQPESGELLVAGEMTSNEFVDSDGWCSLGDVMRRDRDGYLYHVRRLDRMINTGYHVYPDEVEAAITQITGIGRVLVRGEPHARWGEMVVAYLVADAGPASERMIEELRSRLAQRLAKYKIPREFRIVAELPPA